MGEETKFAPRAKELEPLLEEGGPFLAKARHLEALFDEHLPPLKETGSFQEELSKLWTPQAC